MDTIISSIGVVLANRNTHTTILWQFGMLCKSTRIFRTILQHQAMQLKKYKNQMCNVLKSITEIAQKNKTTYHYYHKERILYYISRRIIGLRSGYISDINHTATIIKYYKTWYVHIQDRIYSDEITMIRLSNDGDVHYHQGNRYNFIQCRFCYTLDKYYRDIIVQFIK